MRQIVALDGMRGLAILLVMLFHFGHLGVGWVGVQIFFVLSGFLITSILVREASYPFGFYIKRFYWRRTLRIFPLYILFIAGLTLVFLLVGFNSAFRQQWSYLLTYTFNFVRMRSDYIYPVYWGHLWSLAVEEQFYLIWPALIYFTPARYRRPVMLGIVILAPFSRLVIGALLSPHYGSGQAVATIIHNLTSSQLDAFALGALIATEDPARQKRPGWVLAAVSALALAAGLANWWSYNQHGRLGISTLGYIPNSTDNYLHVWGYTVLNIWSAALVRVLCRKNWLSRIFELKPVAYLGKISYGVYVYHLPARPLLAICLPWMKSIFWPLGFAFYFASVFLVSHLSYQWIERRFLALKDTHFLPSALSPVSRINAV
ncbi:MAG: acyltransferase [Acidobacteria bacterium]|nr:acyltransferase [Acidobacteriota bacterium]MCL5287883.1 acyltransferase [Acidobacteriota bacterium]